MLIERIDLFHVVQELVSPFVTSFGVQQQRHGLLLAMYSEGSIGWGECVAHKEPGYSYETTETAWHILSDFLIPSVLGTEIEEPSELINQLAFVRGHPMAKAALDLAAWDLKAQHDGLSLAELLASPYIEEPRDRVKVGVSVGIQPTIGDTIQVIENYLTQGYGRIKLKIRPGHDLLLAQAVREEFPDTQIMLDANSAYALQDAKRFQAMDDLDLLMLEQPLAHDDIYQHSQLKPLISTPLCLDESILSANQARFALAVNACDIINIKPGRVGGWTEARNIHDLCWSADVPVWCGGMLETGVGRAAQLALASLPGFTLPGDISATDRYYKVDVARPNFVLNEEDSTINVPKGPGLGIEIDQKRLESLSIRQASFNK
jgi:O-succinylbenzoate synthase